MGAYFHIGRVNRVKQLNGVVNEETINISQIPETASNEYVEALIERAVWAQSVLASKMDAPELGSAGGRTEPRKAPAAPPALDLSAFAPASPERICMSCGTKDLAVAIHTPDGLLCEDCAAEDKDDADAPVLETRNSQLETVTAPEPAGALPPSILAAAPEPVQATPSQSQSDSDASESIETRNSELETPVAPKPEPGPHLKLHMQLANPGKGCSVCGDPFAEDSDLQTVAPGVRACGQCRKEDPAAIENAIKAASEPAPEPEPEPEPEPQTPEPARDATSELMDALAASIAQAQAKKAGQPAPPVVLRDENPFPPDYEVSACTGVLGVQIDHPPLHWHEEPITTEGEEGSAGQMIAVNAALTGIGYGKSLRHPAALAILQAYGSIGDQPARDSLASIKDLTKAEAHIILSWLEAPTPYTIQRLRAAIDVITGQGALAA